MKVVFPRGGALVLLKEDLETLKAFYKTNLLNSKMADMYQNASTVIQVNNFNYFPKSNSFVLHDANVLTIEEMRKIIMENVPFSQLEKNRGIYEFYNDTYTIEKDGAYLQYYVQDTNNQLLKSMEVVMYYGKN